MLTAPEDLQTVPEHLLTAPEDRNVHSYDTRQCQLLHVPPCPSNLTKRGVKYRGVKIWNQLLGQEIDIDVSQPVFKHNCKRIIFAGHLDYI